MDITSEIRDHVESQLSKCKLMPTWKKQEFVSFDKLSKSEQFALIALQLNEPDGMDMIYGTDGPAITQLLYSVYAKKNLSCQKAIEMFMDGTLKRYSSHLQELFQEEVERQLNEFDSSEYQLDCISRARDVNASMQARA